MAVLSIKSAGWLHGPGRTVWLGGPIRNFMAWVADGAANTFTVDNLTKITRLTRTDWQGSSPTTLTNTTRTNYCINSETFESWNLKYTTITSNSTTAPNGTLTADKIIANTTAIQHYISTASSTVIGEPICMSIYAKACELTKFMIDSATWATAFGVASNGYASFDLVNGTVISKISTCNAGIISVGNGWYRCWISSLAGATSVADVVFAPTTLDASGNKSTAGDGASGSYIWGAQVENTYTPTAYIGPTTTTPVTVTDYALASEEVTLGETPVAGAVFTLDGDITADVEGA